MPERPLREISRAAATSLSPSLPGRRKVMLPWAATARSVWLLQAKANAESASVKMKPPWAMRWPFTISGRTVMVSVARPGPISAISMPRPLEASSSFHIASAQARARSSGESVALTFTGLLPELYRTCLGRPLCLVSLGAEDTRCQRTQRLNLDVVVIDHHLVGARPRLAGQDESRLG